MPRLTAIVPATNAPPTLRRCLDAIEAAADPPEELLVVEGADTPGAAAARNEGARGATGDVLVFVDSDVLPHPDAFVRVRRAFDSDPQLVALFGSYDDSPVAPGMVSAFRNLLHHHVHQQGAGRAETFWTGLGAIRREAFAETGGFDPGLTSMEDIEFGMRLAASGARIELDPALQGTHLKGWTLAEMIRTDLFGRGVPWLSLLLQEGRGSTALNLGWRHRLSTAASVAGVGSLVLGRPRAAAAAAAALVALNASFYTLLLRRRGPAETAVGVGLHAVHHLTAAAAVPVAVVTHLLGRASK